MPLSDLSPLSYFKELHLLPRVVFTIGGALFFGGLVIKDWMVLLFGVGLVFVSVGVQFLYRPSLARAQPAVHGPPVVVESIPRVALVLARIFCPFCGGLSLSPRFPAHLPSARPMTAQQPMDTDEILADYLKKMGSELGPIFHALSSELSLVHWR